MTAKERRERRRLEIRVEELTAKANHAQAVANDLLTENVEMSIALSSVGELLEEAMTILNSVRRGK